jgi:ABC-2 type transport system ATP-binding protein
MEAAFTEEIGRIRTEGASVLLSSHILSEVEALCDRVSIIRAGKTVETGSLVQLRHLTRTQISFSAAGIDENAVRSIAAAHDVRVASGRVHFAVESDEVASVLPRLAELRVAALTVRPPSLEELFLRHYGDEPAPGDAADPAARSSLQTTAR